MNLLNFDFSFIIIHENREKGLYITLKGLIQLYQAYAFNMERVMGIEPTSSAWKAEVIAIIRHPQCMCVDGREDRI